MAEPNHYDILGVASGASPEQIRRRYRELARQFHPDVHGGDVTANELFISINRAYEVLSDATARAGYDLVLRDRQRQREAGAARVRQQQTASAAPSPGGARPTASTRDDAASRVRPSRVEQLRAAGEQAYQIGNLAAARRLCEEAIRIRPTAAVHELLGDVHTRSQEPTEALYHYTVAVQMEPTNPRLLIKINRLAQIPGMPRPRPRRSQWDPQQDEDTRGRLRAWRRRMSLGVAGAMAIGLILMLGAPIPAEPLEWMFVPKWTLPLVLSMVAAGGLSGMVLSITRAVRALDDEILTPMDGDTSGMLPIGWLLGFFAIAFFWLAIVIYGIVAAFQEGLSASVLRALMLTVALIVAFAALAPEGAGGQVWLLGGNVIFVSMLGGWLVADMLFRPVGES